MIYEIIAITYPDGTPHERQARRKGHIVRIRKIKRGESITAEYTDGSGILSTTRVQSVDEADGVIVVTTRNSVYTFREVAAQ